jgi:carbamoyltransferase
MVWGLIIPIEHPDFYPGTYGRESGASFVAEYPNKFTEIDKHVTVNFDCDKKIDHVSINNSASEGLLFQKLSKKYGFYELDAGKVMGMAAYGKTTETALYNGHTGYLNNNILKFNGDLTKGYIDKEFYSFQEQCDFAFDVQEQTQFNVRNYIWDRVEETGIKNVCLSGGYFLNCVANYKFLKELPKDVNIYVEPISSDAGQSLGIAKYYHHVYNNDYTKRPIKNLYLGIDHKYNKNDIQNTFKDYNISETNKKEVAKLLSEDNIVALYQGKAESGPRALGNRSLLFNPGHQNGQYIVNTIKKREKFRPFACTILNEHKDEWFDLKHMKDSKFMMYAVDCFKPDKIPAVNHVDNTCRIQTLKFNDNQKFYDLINCFYVQTKLPMLLNTSLNLAGDPIVETLEDLKEMLDKCSLNYIYLAEFDLLISKIR